MRRRRFCGSLTAGQSQGSAFTGSCNHRDLHSQVCVAKGPASSEARFCVGLESAFKNLASREELKGISAASMLAALQGAGGLVNKAKMALLAGA